MSKMFRSILALGAGAGAVAALMATSASAAIVSFDGASPGIQTNYVESGFTFDPVRIVNGNCATAPCLALNDNESTTVTAMTPFTLTSFWFQLLGTGTPNTLTVTADGVAFMYAESAYPHNNGGQVIDLSGNAAFQNITSLMFSTFGGGNVRIDDLNLTPIPLPGALPLMLSAIGAAGLMARRRRRQSTQA